MGQSVTLNEVLSLANQLSPVDKARLIQQIAPQIEQALATKQPGQRKSLRGLWRGLSISEEDIADARREMWGSFPRDDA
jgi:hypothetical protein